MKLFLVHALVFAACSALSGFISIFNIRFSGESGSSPVWAILTIAAWFLGFFLEPIVLPAILYRIAGRTPGKAMKGAIILNPLLSLAFSVMIAMVWGIGEESRLTGAILLSAFFVTAGSLFFQIDATRWIIRNKKGDGGILFFILLSFLFQAVSSLVSVDPVMFRIPLGRSVYTMVIHGLIFLMYLEFFIFTMIKLGREFSGKNRRLTEETIAEFGLTPREVEIAGYLLMGHSSQEIGKTLFIAKKTVDTHIYNIYRKCGVTSKIGFFNLAG